MNISAIKRNKGTLRKNGAPKLLIKKQQLYWLMRVSFIVNLLLAISIQMLWASSSHGQSVAKETVTIGLKQETFKSFIKKIEDQTRFRFYYRKQEIKSLNNLNIPEAKRTVGQTLQILLQDTYFSFRQIDNHILIEKKADSSKFKLSGIIVDTAGRHLNIGSVRLNSLIDSAAVWYANPDKAGSFLFPSIEEGKYTLSISCVGYMQETRTISLTQDIDLEIVLKTKPIELNEVKVFGSREMFSNHNGNIKVNIENSIFSNNPSPVDLISKLPAVQVSPNGERLTIIGRGEPLIYLDNQRITVNDLMSMSTKDIKSIEIINNPSAKYEAGGQSVIQIVRNRSQSEGLKIDLTENLSRKRYFQSRNGLNISYKKDKFEVRGNIQYNALKLWESNGNEFYILDKDIISQYRLLSIGTRKQGIVNAGLYYQFNDSDYLSLTTSKRWQDGKFTINTNSFISQPQSQDGIVTDNYNSGGRPYLTNNLNYNKAFKKLKGQLFFGAQYSRFSNYLTSNIYNDYNQTQSIITQDRYQNYHVSVWSGRADFEKQMGKNTKWQLGAALSAADSKSILTLDNYVPPLQSASQFNYSEHIYGAYTQLTGNIEKFSYSAGLRIENTEANGNFSNSSGRLVNKRYNSIFPKGEINFSTGKTQKIIFGYAKSITRPNYSTASQITTYINPFFEWAHNVNIDPTFKNELYANYQIKDKSFGISLYTLKNPIFYGTQFNDQTNVLTLIDQNYKQQRGINVSLTVPFKLNTWSSTNLIRGTLDEIRDPAAQLNPSRPYLYLYSNNQLKIPHNFTFLISAWALTKRTEGVFERNGMFAVDFGLSKAFSKSLTATINYYSLLATREAKEIFTINNIRSNSIYFSDVREFSLTLTYSFGRLLNSKYKNKQVDDNVDRIK
jgi:hypothetical protein